jgi:hypothetical protein
MIEQHFHQHVGLAKAMQWINNNNTNNMTQQNNTSNVMNQL